MTIETTYAIWPRDLDFGKLFTVVEKFALKREMKRFATTFLRVNVDPSESMTAHSLEEFGELFKSLPTFDRLSSLQRFVDKSGVSLRVDLVCRGNLLQVSVTSDNPDMVRLLHDQLRSDFRLRKSPVPTADVKRATFPQPTVFLGRHFDERASAIAEKLKQFLRLLGMDVLEGESYTAQPIPTKVTSRIDTQEIYLGLVTQNPEHDWITAEASYAKGGGKHVILMVEAGAKFNPTILGQDFEQARFTGDSVEESFIKLLQEFRDIGVRIR